MREIVHATTLYKTFSCDHCGKPVVSDCQIDEGWFNLPCGCYDGLDGRRLPPMTPEEIAMAMLLAKEY